MMAKKKKVNPRRIPISEKEREKNASSLAINAAWAIFFTALRDKEGYGPKRLYRVWEEVNNISQSISEGYVNVKDLSDVLKKECGIELI